MAIKSFILSNDDGRITTSVSSSASIDDGVGAGSTIGKANFNKINFKNYTLGSFNLFPNKRLVTLNASTPGNILQVSSHSGTLTSGALGFSGIVAVASHIIPSDYVGIVSNGDIRGDYKYDVQVKNIGNVSSGSLPASNGGTGLTGSQYAFSNNLILKVSGSNPIFSTLSASASGTIIASGEGRIDVMFPAYKPNVKFYGTPGTYVWKKPIGAKYARVILQGPGGGAGGSRAGASLYNGTGGGGGAFTDVTLDVSSIISGTILVGTGGTGGTNATNATPGGGFAGTQSTFTAHKIFLSASPGGGGFSGTANTGRPGGAGGGVFSVTSGGYSRAGGAAPGNGAAANIINYARCGGGFAGGWYGVIDVIPIISSTCFGYNITVDGIDIGNLNFYGPQTSEVNPNTKARYGVGGSATTAAAAITGTKGCQGGDGYAIIISW